MATKGDISGLDEFIYGGEPLVPMVNGFTRRRLSGVVRSNVPGGLMRQRKKFYNQPYHADVTYFLETPQQQDFIKIFFERNEGKKFIAYLRADRPILEPYVVQVVSDWEDAYASAVDGLVTFTLEIISVRDPELDKSSFDLYQQVGDDVAAYYDGFQDIVEAMPDNE